MTDKISKIQILTTEDGSPTAAFTDYEGEKMHHSGGAFGETVYIFGPALQWGFSKVESPHVISLGTGLAYNEILTAAFGVLFDQDFQLVSFEKDEYLNSNLKSWVLGKECELQSVYNAILKKTADVFEIPEIEIKNKLLEKLDNKSWLICEAFPEDASVSEKFNVVLYDFFSSKAMENFWSESFLTLFLNNLTDGNCAFATYACTGNLKRAFKATGFQFYKRRGYLWKRSSTFAAKSNS